MEEEEATQQRVTASSLSTESLASTAYEGAQLISQTLLLQSSSPPRDNATHMQGSSTACKIGRDESKVSAQHPDEETIVEDAVEAHKKQTENQLQMSVCSTSLFKPSPTSVSQNSPSAPSPTIPEQRSSPPKANSVPVPKVEKGTPSDGTILSSVSVARASPSDGYNWRKYGQKQVKSPTGSRSYYRCTHSNCCAKKIKFCDHSGYVIEIVYKSQHSHDPPHKIDSPKESNLAPASEPKIECSVPKQCSRVLNDSDPSSSPKECLYESPCSANKNLENSSNGENGVVLLNEEHVIDPKPKRRLNKGDLTCLDSAVKSGKKPKYVVHAEEDMGISGDGYRWRKYGQKLVKGNPHFRNYYRCSSAGCPVRKHIETDVDNAKALIITYKGVHDHDKPVPKKRHGPPSASLVAASAPASINNLQSKKGVLIQDQETSGQCPEDTEEEELTGEALELGGEKAIESARTLLSIGFEIKPC